MVYRNSASEVTKVEPVGSKRKVDWTDQYDAQYPAESQAQPALKKAPSEQIDSIESIAPPVEKSIPAIQKKEESSPGFWSKVWSGFCTLFSTQAVVDLATSGSSNKARRRWSLPHRRKALPRSPLSVRPEKVYPIARRDAPIPDANPGDQ